MAVAVLMAALPSLSLIAQAPEPSEQGGLFWWNDRVFYQIFVRSFYDSDGDGIGDFQGMIEKLDYLNDGDPTTDTDLGVTGIWLMPINPSPSEHGYDVTDYFAVNPDYGTMNDFQDFLDAAHERGIAVIIDLVLNHSSSEHPWFQASAAGDPTYADYYVWADENPGFSGPDRQTVWHKNGDRWYYGVFWSGMPDLNYANPAVTAEMYAVVDFWLDDVGVDGFRVDAVKYVVEEGRALENTRATHDWLKDFHAYLRSVNPNALLVGEIWDSTELVTPYVGGEMDIAFEFDFAGALVRASNFRQVQTLLRGLQPALDAYPEGQFATFAVNHDMDRYITQAGGNYDGAKLAAYALLTVPGVPFIYYGEEIAMEGRRTLNTDNERRRPMQWDGTPTAGFTDGSPWFALNDNAAEINVAAQETDPNSVFNAYRTLIHLRNDTPALRTGVMNVVASSNRRTLTFTRSTPEQTVMVILNMDDQPTDSFLLSGTLPMTALSEVRVLLGDGEPAAPTLAADGVFTDWQPVPDLDAYEILVVELIP
jgi:glycosidase